MNQDMTQALELPESYTIRPTTLDDAEAVTILQETASQAIGLESKSDPDGLRSDWQSPKFDLTSRKYTIK